MAIDRKAFQIGYEKGWEDAVFQLLNMPPAEYQPYPHRVEEAFEEYDYE